MFRQVHVAATTVDHFQKQPRTVEDNLQYSSETIDKIATEKPDIICLTETFDTRWVSGNHSEMAQEINGPTVTHMRAKARQHKCYIICPFIEKRGDHLYNTALLIDRGGEIVGSYDKIHPTAGTGEVEDYIIPGDLKPKILKTDFGNIGCQICFDANWWHNWLELKEAGAEIIFFASAYPAGRVLNAMATLFHVPIVAASTIHTCKIIDIDGLNIDHEGIYKSWVSGTLYLDSPLFHLDFHFDKIDQIRRDYGRKVRIRVYEEEAWWRILPGDEVEDVHELIKKYKLEPFSDYLVRAEGIQVEGRKIMRTVPTEKPALATAAAH